MLTPKRQRLRGSAFALPYLLNASSRVSLLSGILRRAAFDGFVGLGRFTCSANKKAPLWSWVKPTVEHPVHSLILPTSKPACSRWTRSYPTSRIRVTSNFGHSTHPASGIGPHPANFSKFFVLIASADCQILTAPPLFWSRSGGRTVPNFVPSVRLHAFVSPRTEERETLMCTSKSQFRQMALNY